MITVEANAAIFVDVGMEHFATEGNVRSLIGIGLTELEFELEETALPWGSLGPFDDSLPLEEIFIFGSRVDASVFFFLNFLQVFEEPSCCRASHFWNYYL